MTKNNDYITTFQAAELLGFSPDYIRRLIVKDKIKAIKMGNNYLLRPNDLVGIKRQRHSRKGEAFGST